MNQTLESPTPETIQNEYDRGVRYNEGMNLYSKVKTCERFFEGNQWEGVKVETVKPITMNQLDTIGYYKIAQIVSMDVGNQIEPFLDDEEAKRAAKILEQSIDRVVERQKIKLMHTELLRDALVDGDTALYFWFDGNKPTGLDGVPGEIQAESLMNTNILFGNPHSRDVQRQPYIIVVRRRPVAEARREAEKQGVPEWESITGDSEGLYKGDDEQVDADSLCTELTRFWRGDDGKIKYCKCIGRVMTTPEVQTEMTLYPMAYMSWKPRKNSYHGVREFDSMINTQISVNKQYTALDIQLRNNAMPKMVYDARKFPDGWNPNARYIAIMDDPSKALTGVAGAMPIPTEATGITQNIISEMKNCAGANDAALGNIKNPQNSSAIVAVQAANAAPLALTRLAYYQFVEDYTRVLIDMMHAYYGLRQVKIKVKQTDPVTGETREDTAIEEYNFDELPVDAMDLSIEIGEANYWAKTLQTTTLDNLRNAGVIQDNVEYLERIPDGSVPDKSGLIESVKRLQKAQQAAQLQSMM